MRVVSYAVGPVLLMTKCIPLYDHQLVEDLHLLTECKLAFKTPKGWNSLKILQNTNYKKEGYLIGMVDICC